MKNIANYPPSWCPDAVPSDRGWRHPKTGELLVSVRGGVRRMEEAAQLVEVPVAVEVLSEEVGESIIDETVQGEAVLADEQPQEVITETKTTTKKRRVKNVQ